MRTTFAALLSFFFAVVLSAAPAETASMTPDALLQRGLGSYRAGHYSDAANDLNAAAQALLSQDQMQSYVNTGKFPGLDKFETALVYLTLAESKLGHEEKAREAVLRLMTGERIDSQYAQLPLEADAAEFEPIAAQLVPGSTLPANAQLARAGTRTTTPTPAPTVAQTTPPSPTAAATTTTVATTTAATPPPAPIPCPPPAATTTTVAQAPPAPAPAQTAETTTARPVVQPALETERAERQRIIDDLVAQERAKIQKAADERIAADRAAAQKVADERIVADRAAAQKAADERIVADRAAAQKAADERIAAERAAAQKASDERLEAERASIQRAADERIAAAQKAAAAQIAAMQAQNRRNYIASLRQADAYAANGQTDRANDIYNAVVSAQDAPREIVAEAAVGLYRTGAFRSAANALRKLAPFARGEEDLRYYQAVSLYETGNYADAKKELACALPFIQVTEDVSRYQSKIERTPSRQASLQ